MEEGQIMKEGIVCRPGGFSDEDEWVDSWSGSTAVKVHRQYRPPGSSGVMAQFEAFVKLDDLEGVKYLMGDGMTIHSKDPAGFTGLMVACNHGRPDIVRYLLEQGFNPNAYNSKLIFPIMAVCFSPCKNESNLVECAKLLIEYHANVNAVDAHGTTALMYACKMGYALVVKELVKNNVSIEICDVQRWTALFYAADGVHGRIVRLLLKAGANKLKIDVHGQRPFAIAMLKPGGKDVAEILCPKQFRQKMLAARGPGYDKIDMETEVESFLRKLGDVDRNLCKPRPTEKGAELNLYEFLTTTDEELSMLGVRFVWQRKQALEFIKHFHSESWILMKQPRRSLYEQIIADWKAQYGHHDRCKDSIPEMTYMNCAHIVIGLSQRLTILTATAKYMDMQVGLDSGVYSEKIQCQIKLLSLNLLRLVNELESLNKSLDLHDQEAVIPADCILTNSLAPKGFSNVTIIGLVAVTAFAVWKAKAIFF